MDALRKLELAKMKDELQKRLDELVDMERQWDDEIDYKEYSTTLAKNEYFPHLQEYIESNFEIPDELYSLSDLSPPTATPTCSVSSMESLSSVDEEEFEDLN